MIVYAAVFDSGHRPLRMQGLYDLLGPTAFAWVSRAIAALWVLAVYLLMRDRYRTDRRIERFVDARAMLEPERKVLKPEER